MQDHGTILPLVIARARSDEKDQIKVIRRFSSYNSSTSSSYYVSCFFNTVSNFRTSSFLPHTRRTTTRRLPYGRYVTYHHRYVMPLAGRSQSQWSHY